MLKKLIRQKLLYLIVLSSILFSGCINPSFLNRSNPTSFQELNYEKPIDKPEISIYFDWNKTFENFGEDSGRDMVIDTQGNIYLTGKEYNSSRGVYDILIAKFNNTGEQEWTTTFETDSDGIGYGIDIDNSQYLYITGYLENNNEDVNVVLLKYDINGIYQWNQTWGGDEWDVGYGLAVNNSNEIYITGYTDSYDVFGDVVLLKYNSTGDLQWYETFGGTDTDVGYNLDIDSNDNIYIVGYSSSFGAVASNGYLIKYNRTRELEWNKTWGGNFPDDFYDLIINENDEIFICGNTKSYSNGLNDVTILKYSSTGNKLFNFSWGGAKQEYAYSISFDSNNNAYITGYTKSYGESDNDACVVKFNETGNFQWFKLWGQTLEDESFCISIDNSDNIFITGKSQISGSDYDMFLTKYTMKPDGFILSSNAEHPDPDGNFTLTWDVSLDANNYSLYQFDKSISEYNDSLTNLVKGNTNRSFEMKNLEEETYYFMVFAFNGYGNTSSNCLKVVVQYPPEDFDLSANNENPDTDGMVNLTWTNSIGAYNYSVYSHNSYIHEINNNGTLIISGLINNSYFIEGLTNGEYYYAVVAINPAGKTTSNCSEIIVRRKADYFTLYSNADSPDSDGAFDLIWTKSEFSKNYTIYFSTSYIAEINHTVQSIYNFTPEFDWPTYRYPITGKGTGTYYYKVIAFNEYGNYTSKCLIIVVKIPSSSNGDSNDGKDDTAEINPYILPIIFFSVLGILIGLVVLLGKKRGKF